MCRVFLVYLITTAVLFFSCGGTEINDDAIKPDAEKKDSTAEKTESELACINLYDVCHKYAVDISGNPIPRDQCEETMEEEGNIVAMKCLVTATCAELYQCFLNNIAHAACYNIYQTCNKTLTWDGKEIGQSQCFEILSNPPSAAEIDVVTCFATTTECSHLWDCSPG